MELIPLPAFADNYIWMLHDGQAALVVDPGDAQPALEALQRSGLQLRPILVTPHHAGWAGWHPSRTEIYACRGTSPRQCAPLQRAVHAAPSPCLRAREPGAVRAARGFDRSTHDDAGVPMARRQWHHEFQ